MTSFVKRVDMGGLTLVVDGLRVGATKPGQSGTELTGTEIALLDGLTAGTVTASKAVVVDANKDVASFRDVTTRKVAIGDSANDHTITFVSASDEAANRTLTVPALGGNDTLMTLGTAQTVTGIKTMSGANVITHAPTGLKVQDSDATHVVTIAPGNESADRTLSLPVLGGADTVMTLGTAQSVAGAKTFTAAIVPTAGVGAAGGFSVSPRGWWVGQTAPQVSSDFNNSTPSTTETYVSEIFVPCNCTITGVALFNGSDVTGNVTVGLADSSGAPIAAAKSASTAGSGTDAIQRIPFATPYAAVGPATYFIQVQYDSATARYNTHVLGNHGVLVQTSQVYGTFASFTAPTTFVTNVGNVAALY